MNYIYTMLTPKELEDKFNTSLKTGLTDKEVLNRQEHYGLNQIAQEQSRWLKALTNQLTSPFIYLLIIAVIISFFWKLIKLMD